MPRGGKRPGAGRKSSWPSGCGREDTKLIRVPKKLADELLEIAHRLDGGEQVCFADVMSTSDFSSVSTPDEPESLPLWGIQPCLEDEIDFSSIDFSDVEQPLTLREAAEKVGCASSTLQVWKSKYSASELAGKTFAKSGEARIALTFRDGKYYAKRIGNTI